MKRLITFGCSFTLYNWPTWADLLGKEYDIDFNWGYPGLGNRAIAERVAEAHARLNFTPDDTVIIQWSSPIRHDWMRTNTFSSEGTYWRTKGSIFSRENSVVFDKKWVDTFWDEKAYMLNTLNHILLTIGLLEGCGVKWMMTSMNDFTKMGNDIGPNNMNGEYQAPGKRLKNFWDVDQSLTIYKEAIFDKYKDKWVDPIINVVPETEELNWFFDFDPTRDEERGYPLKDGKWEEAHPTTRQHAIWMLKLKDQMGLEPQLTQEQVDLIREIEKIKEDTSTFKQFEDTIMTIPWFLHRNRRGF